MTKEYTKLYEQLNNFYNELTTFVTNSNQYDPEIKIYIDQNELITIDYNILINKYNIIKTNDFCNYIKNNYPNCIDFKIEFNNLTTIKQNINETIKKYEQSPAKQRYLIEQKKQEEKEKKQQEERDIKDAIEKELTNYNLNKEIFYKLVAGYKNINDELKTLVNKCQKNTDQNINEINKFIDEITIFQNKYSTILTFVNNNNAILNNKFFEFYLNENQTFISNLKRLTICLNTQNDAINIIKQKAQEEAQRLAQEEAQKKADKERQINMNLNKLLNYNITRNDILIFYNNFNDLLNESGVYVLQIKDKDIDLQKVNNYITKLNTNIYNFFSNEKNKDEINLFIPFGFKKEKLETFHINLVAIAEYKNQKDVERKVQEEAQRKVQEEVQRKIQEEEQRKAQRKAQEAQEEVQLKALRKAQEAEAQRREQAEALRIAQEANAQREEYSRKKAQADVEEQRRAHEKLLRKAKEEAQCTKPKFENCTYKQIPHGLKNFGVTCWFNSLLQILGMLFNNKEINKNDIVDGTIYAIIQFLYIYPNNYLQSIDNINNLLTTELSDFLNTHNLKCNQLDFEEILNSYNILYDLPDIAIIKNTQMRNEKLLINQETITQTFNKSNNTLYDSYSKPEQLSIFIIPLEKNYNSLNTFINDTINNTIEEIDNDDTTKISFIRHIIKKTIYDFTKNKILFIKPQLFDFNNNKFYNKNIDISQQLNIQNFTYTLYGIIIHNGYHRNEGHYIAYIKVKETKLIYECNDTIVTQSNFPTELFYTYNNNLSKCALLVYIKNE